MKWTKEAGTLEIIKDVLDDKDIVTKVFKAKYPIQLTNSEMISLKKYVQDWMKDAKESMREDVGHSDFDFPIYEFATDAIKDWLKSKKKIAWLSQASLNKQALLSKQARGFHEMIMKLVKQHNGESVSPDPKVYAITFEDNNDREAFEKELDALGVEYRDWTGAVSFETESLLKQAFQSVQEVCKEQIEMMKGQHDFEQIEHFWNEVSKTVPHDYVSIYSETEDKKESELWDVLRDQFGLGHEGGKKLLSYGDLDLYEINKNGTKIYSVDAMTFNYFIPKSLLDTLQKQSLLTQANTAEQDAEKMLWEKGLPYEIIVVELVKNFNLSRNEAKNIIDKLMQDEQDHRVNGDKSMWLNEAAKEKLEVFDWKEEGDAKAFVARELQKCNDVWDFGGGSDSYVLFSAPKGTKITPELKDTWNLEGYHAKKVTHERTMGSLKESAWVEAGSKEDYITALKRELKEKQMLLKDHPEQKTYQDQIDRIKKLIENVLKASLNKQADINKLLQKFDSMGLWLDSDEIKDFKTKVKNSKSIEEAQKVIDGFWPKGDSIHNDLTKSLNASLNTESGWMKKKDTEQKDDLVDAADIEDEFMAYIKRNNEDVSVDNLIEFIDNEYPNASQNVKNQVIKMISLKKEASLNKQAIKIGPLTLLTRKPSKSEDLPKVIEKEAAPTFEEKVTQLLALAQKYQTLDNEIKKLQAELITPLKEKEKEKGLEVEELANKGISYLKSIKGHAVLVNGFVAWLRTSGGESYMAEPSYTELMDVLKEKMPALAEQVAKIATELELVKQEVSEEVNELVLYPDKPENPKKSMIQIEAGLWVDAGVKKANAIMETINERLEEAEGDWEEIAESFESAQNKTQDWLSDIELGVEAPAEEMAEASLEASIKQIASVDSFKKWMIENSKDDPAFQGEFAAATDELKTVNDLAYWLIGQKGWSEQTVIDTLTDYISKSASLNKSAGEVLDSDQLINFFKDLDKKMKDNNGLEPTGKDIQESIDHAKSPETVSIETSHEVGVGVASPSAWLDVKAYRMNAFPTAEYVVMVHRANEKQDEWMKLKSLLKEFAESKGSMFTDFDGSFSVNIVSRNHAEAKKQVKEYVTSKMGTAEIKIAGPEFKLGDSVSVNLATGEILGIINDLSKGQAYIEYLDPKDNEVKHEWFDQDLLIKQSSLDKLLASLTNFEAFKEYLLNNAADFGTGLDKDEHDAAIKAINASHSIDELKQTLKEYNLWDQSLFNTFLEDFIEKGASLSKQAHYRLPEQFESTDEVLVTLPNGEEDSGLIEGWNYDEQRMRVRLDMSGKTQWFDVKYVRPAGQDGETKASLKVEADHKKFPSEFDKSTGLIELVEENGKKSIRIKKNLGTKVSETIKDLFSGAYKQGERVYVDFGEDMEIAEVKNYLGNHEYVVESNGKQWRTNTNHIMPLNKMRLF